VWPRGWVQVQLYSSMTAALEGGEWSAARPSRTLPPGRTRYPFYRRLGWGRSGRAENLVPTGIRSRTVQPLSVAIPTELPGPPITDVKYVFCPLLCYVTEPFSPFFFSRSVVCTQRPSHIYRVLSSLITSFLIDPTTNTKFSYSKALS